MNECANRFGPVSLTVVRVHQPPGENVPCTLPIVEPCLLPLLLSHTVMVVAGYTASVTEGCM